MVRFLTAGESHGSALTVIVEGLPAGIPIDPRAVARVMRRRRAGYGRGGRMAIETYDVEIVGGVRFGATLGAPVALRIVNRDYERWREAMRTDSPRPPGDAARAVTRPRPGHADLTGAVKYGYRDLRPTLERSSARETTMRVAAGAVCKHFLSQFGIVVGGYVRAIGDVEAELNGSDHVARFKAAEENDVRCPDPVAAEKMRVRIEEIIHGKDTLGGVLEIVALNVPVGLGSYAQWDRRLEARLAQAVLSVQAMKGVEIGDAFENARRPGTRAHDAITLTPGPSPKLGEERLARPTNRAGGTEGGVTNGQPLVIRAAMKPIATTLTPQMTVDLATGQEGPARYERSDFCPVPRAVPILEAMVAFVLADALIEKLGGDALDEMRPRFEALRQARLEDLPMDNHPHVWWE